MMMMVYYAPNIIKLARRLAPRRLARFAHGEPSAMSSCDCAHRCTTGEQQWDYTSTNRRGKKSTKHNTT